MAASARRKPDLGELSQAREPSKLFGRLLLLVILAAVAFGGYYFYCSWQASKAHPAFDKQLVDLRQGLLYLDRRVEPKDVEEVLAGYAKKAKVTILRAQVTFEPLDSTTINKLNVITRTAMGIARKMSKHRLPACVIGAKVELEARHGIAKKTFTSERYTWFDYVAAGSCLGSAR